MKRDQVRKVIEKHLGKIGVSRAHYTWEGAKLLVLIGGQMKVFTMRSGISQRAMAFQMGHMAGLAEAAGITARKANGAHAPGPGLQEVPAQLGLV